MGAHEKTFVVNGYDISYEMYPNSKIKRYRDKALEDTNNTGREFWEWEIHDDEGFLIDPNTPVKDINSDRLFLNLGVGAGG